MLLQRLVTGTAESLTASTDASKSSKDSFGQAVTGLVEGHDNVVLHVLIICKRQLVSVGQSEPP